MGGSFHLGGCNIFKTTFSTGAFPGVRKALVARGVVTWPMRNESIKQSLYKVGPYDRYKWSYNPCKWTYTVYMGYWGYNPKKVEFELHLCHLRQESRMIP